MRLSILRAAAIPGTAVGAAAWVSLGYLDAIPSTDRTIRLALLPSWLLLPVAVTIGVAMCAAAAAWLTAVHVRLSFVDCRFQVARLFPRAYLQSADRQSSIVNRQSSIDQYTYQATTDALRPLSASALLLLPYFPWLPDVIPVLTVLAGPGRWLVWFTILAATAHSIVIANRLLKNRSVNAQRKMPDATSRIRRWAFGILPSGRVVQRPRWLPLVGVLVAGFVASSVAASRLTSTALYPAGDEPHYLIIAQSLWRDGDLRIENNHARGEYREYYDVVTDLAPHYLTRGADGEIYSVHPIGLPLLMAPIFGVAGYRGVVLALMLAASLAGCLAWIWMRRIGLSPSAAVFGWMAVYLSAPFLLQSFAVYPEVLAGLTLIGAMVLATDPLTGPSGSLSPVGGEGWDEGALRSRVALRWLVVGAAAGCLPWLSTKYAPVAAIVVAVALGRLWIGRPASAEALAARLRCTFGLLTPFAASVAAWFAFFQIYWGTPSPTAPYGSLYQTHPIQLRTGAPGLAFDQEYGLLPYAPVMLLSFTGLVTMVRAGGHARRLAIEIACAVGALIAAVGAFRIWWGGSSSPGRPLVSGLLLLAIPVAWHYANAQRRPLVSAADRLLLTWSIGVTAMLVFARQGLLIDNGRDGSSTLLEYLSPVWNLAAMVPSFIRDTPLVALRNVALWLALASLPSAWLTRREHRVAHRRADSGNGPGGAAALKALLLAFAVVAFVSVISPIIMGTHAAPDLDLTDRPRIALLDRFDHARLPTGVVYDAFRVVDASAVPPLLSLAVEPPMAGPAVRSAEPLLYGRRLTLPAGRYEMTVTTAPRGTPAEGTLMLRLGRRDPEYMRWDVRLAAGDVWSTTFELAIDVSYVGLRATPSLEAARPRIRIRPLSVVDASLRPSHPPVLGAIRYGGTSVFFFDAAAWAEPTGFWVRGGRTASVLVARQAEAKPASQLRLATHCGPVANSVRIASRAESHELELAPGQRHNVALPAEDNRVHVEVTPLRSFVPAAVDPASEDTRELGCWVEVTEWLE